MSAPKIVAAWVNRRLEPWLLYGDGGIGVFDATRLADARLAESGQRAVWPVGHGVAVIEDIPRPEPLPTAYVYALNGGHQATITPPARWINPNAVLVCTYSADADDNATVVRHEVQP